MKTREVFERDGFTFTPSTNEGYRVSCDQCAALVINGVPCHETGCVNNKPEPDFDLVDETYTVQKTRKVLQEVSK